MIWHSAEIDALKKELSTDFDKGLSDKQVKEILNRQGENVIESHDRPPVKELILSKIKKLPSVMLIAAALISLLLSILDKGTSWSKNILEPIMILVIWILYIALYVICDICTDRAIVKLNNSKSTKVKVLRNAKVGLCSSKLIVPGDIIRVDEGDYIPCDCRIIKSVDLRCDESALTGEDLPINKSESTVLTDIAPIEERRNMLFCGSFVTNGSAIAVVTETGNNCEISKISTVSAHAKPDINSLQKKFDTFEKQIRNFAIIGGLILFIAGIIPGIDKMPMFMTAITFAAVMIPSFLSSACMLTTAHAALNLSKNDTFVNDIDTLEKLGRTTVLCVDKTGILTKNKMKLVSAYTSGGFVKSLTELNSAETTLLRFSALCCDSSLKDNENADPTETALLESAQKYTGSSKETLDNLYPRLAEIPFDSERKAMSTVHMISGKPIAIVKGAPEYLFERCLEIDSESVNKANQLMCTRGLRTLAVCCKPLTAIPTNPIPDQIENNLTFLGLVGLIDPPDNEVKQYIADCKTAGITTVMITGDHVETATAVSEELGIMQSENHQALSGEDIRNVPDAELAEMIKDVRVCARLSSEDKQRIIKAYRDSGEVVAVTGYSSLDVPSLKSADIGYAIGNDDIAAKNADITSKNDNFKTIISSVSYGRSIHANMQRITEFLLTSAIGQFLFILISSILWKNTFSSIQILWMNLIACMSGFALCCEAPKPEIMEKAPSTGYEKITSVSMFKRIIIHSLTLAALPLVAYLIAKSNGLSMAFAVMSISLLITVFNVRSKRSLFRIGLFNNSSVNLTTLIGLALILIVLITPICRLFALSYISPVMWLWVAGLSLVNFIVAEFAKLCEKLFGDK